MSHYIPDVIYQFFLPNDEGPTLPPEPHKKKNYIPFDPVSNLIGHLPALPPPRQYTTKAQEDAAIRAEREEQHAIAIAQARQEYDRHSEPLQDGSRLTTNPNHTLFVGRLDYRITTEMLCEEFKEFGNVVHAHVVRDPITEESRGYGFVEYETAEERNNAYHHADKQKILDRHIVVDVERRRTHGDFFPRRLGGGLGQTRASRRADRVSVPGRIEDYYRARDEERRRHEDLQRQRYSNSQFDRRSGGYRGGGSNSSHYRGGHRDSYNSHRDRDRDRDRDRHYHNSRPHFQSNSGSGGQNSGFFHRRSGAAYHS